MIRPAFQVAVVMFFFISSTVQGVPKKAQHQGLCSIYIYRLIQMVKYRYNQSNNTYSPLITRIQYK